MKTPKQDFEAMALAAVMSLWSLPLLICLAVVACTSPAAVEGSQDPAAAAVVGEWAAPLPGDLVGLVGLSLTAGKAYTATISAGQAGDLVEREKGVWTLRAGRVVMMPATCEAAAAAGAALVLKACTGPDSLAVAIEGDTWPVTLRAGGQLLQLTFHRL